MKTNYTYNLLRDIDVREVAINGSGGINWHIEWKVEKDKNEKLKSEIQEQKLFIAQLKHLLLEDGELSALLEDFFRYVKEYAPPKGQAEEYIESIYKEIT